MIKKTYIPAKPRNNKLIGTSMSGGVAGSVSSSSTGSADPNSHTHPNKRILDIITQEMLDNALREMLGVDSLEEPTDENYFSALRTIAEIVNNNEVLKDLFLSKISDDTAQGFIQFLKGISVKELATLTQGLEIGDYTQGFLGSGGIFKMKDGISEIEVDKLTVRMIATFFEIVVSKISHIGGQLLLTPARMKCIKVEELTNVYRCYFDKGENGEAVNEFQVGDQARCQVFTGSGTKFYWRLVTAIGTDYIELSKSDKLGDSIPAIGDDIVQLGNRTNKERRNAIILSTVGDDAPSWKQYEGINSFSLKGKEATVFSSKGNRIQGKTVFVGDREETLDDWASGVTDDLEDIQAKIDEEVIKVTYWSIKYSSPVIYKDSNSATTSGVHTPITVNGELRNGTTTTQGGFISVQPNGGAETSATASPRIIAPTNTEGKTSYTIRLYEKADKVTLLDIMTIPVVFKGASGVNAINAVLSNEADVLPASPEGVVGDYSGSGTEIRVFEGATELSYGTGNGQYQVSVSGSGITAGTPTTVGNTRVYPKASNMTLDNATLTFTISGKTASGATFSLIKTQAFAKSRTGQKGDNGKSITLVDVEFAVNTLPTTPPVKTSNLWKTLADTLTGDEQLWTRTKTTYSVGDPTYTKPANITPKTGADGNSITSITEWYYLSTSKTELTGGSWSTTPWTWVNGKFIWTKTVFTYSKTADTETLPTVSSEWEAVNELEIVGRNLLLNSNFKTNSYNGWSSVYGTQKITQDGYIKTYTSVTKYARIHKAFTLSEIGTFTFSVKVKTSVAIDWQSWDGLSIKDIKVKLIEDDFEIHSITFTNTNAGSKIIRGYQRNAPIGTTTLIEWEKLEKGNKATDWSPAPEDQILEIGGRNLLLDSKVSVTNAYNNRQYLSLSEQTIVGQRYTFSIRCDDLKGGELWLYDDTSFKDIGALILISGNIYGVTFNAVDSFNNICIRNTGNRDNPITTYEAKLEKGNKATDWTPAPEDVQAEIDAAKNEALALGYLKEAIGQDAVLNGALFTLVTMLLKENMNGDVTAGISGKQTGEGEQKNLPAFWAGGTYGQAIGNTAKAIIRHDGTSKFTDTEITGTVNAKSGSIGVLDVASSGQVKLEDPDTGNTRLSFIKSNIPLLADLLNTTYFGDSITAAATSVSIPNFGSSTSYLSGSLNVLSASTISITGGAKIGLNIYSIDPDVSVDLTLYLTKNGAKYRILETLQIVGKAYNVERTVKSTTVEGVSSGEYRLMLGVTKRGSGVASGLGNVKSIPMSWSFKQSGIRNFLFGLNGFLSYFSDRHIYFSEEGGFDLRGKTNMPGLLGSASIIGGKLSNEWGRITGVAISGSGYRVTISGMTHDKYTVQITSHTTNQWRIGTKTSSNFTIFGTGNCDIAIMGNNY